MVRRKKKRGDFLIHCEKRSSTFNALLDTGLEIEIKDEEKSLTLLQYGSYNGHSEIVNVLLSKGAEMEARTENGHTSLILASLENHGEVVKLLLGSGANLEAQTNQGVTALICATQFGHVDVVQILIEREGPTLRPNKKMVGLLLYLHLQAVI